MMTRQQKLLILLAAGALFLLSRTNRGQLLMSDVMTKLASLLGIEEGEKLTAYQDTGGAWTIGKGHKIVPGDGLYPYGEKRTITKAESDLLFSKDTAIARAAVDSAVKVPLNVNEFTALASLAFNIGAGAFKSSTLVKLLNQGDRVGAKNQFAVWKFDNGKVNPQLVNRRAREASLFGAAV